MLKWFKSKKKESKKDDSEEPTNEADPEAVPDAENDSENDAANSETEQKEEEISEPQSHTDSEGNEAPADNEPNSDSVLPDGENSENVSAEVAESASYEGKSGESSEMSEPTADGSKSTEATSNENGLEYTFDEAVDQAGYGNFQRILTMLVGFCWLADAFEVLIISIVGDFISCDFVMHMWQDALLSSNLFIGMVFGGPVFGVIADTLGRRRAVAISMLIAFIFGALGAITPTIEWMLASRVFVGFALGSLAQGVTLCIEYYPINSRGIAGFYINYYWSFGNVFLVLVAWAVLESTDEWRWLMFAVSLPALFVFISTFWYPESVRFYLVSNQYEKAVVQLQKLATTNKAELPPGKLQRNDSGEDEEAKGSIVDLLKSPHTLTTILFWYMWFAIAFHYYGLALMTPIVVMQGKVNVSPKESAQVFKSNATTTSEFFLSRVPCKTLTNANYFDLLWTGSAEIPGMFIFSILIQHIHRKRLLCATVLVNTVLIFFLLVDFISTIPGKIVLYIARGNSGGIFQLIMIMTSEAFPTTLRATSMGSSHAFSMFGAAIVPFVAQVLIIRDPVATVCLLSGVVFLCAVAAILLPREMKGVHIKDYSKEYKEVEKKTSIL